MVMMTVAAAVVDPAEALLEVVTEVAVRRAEVELWVARSEAAMRVAVEEVVATVATTDWATAAAPQVVREARAGRW